MKNRENKKKEWVKPTVETLKIKKDTFSGSGRAAENINFQESTRRV